MEIDCLVLCLAADEEKVRQLLRRQSWRVLCAIDMPPDQIPSMVYNAGEEVIGHWVRWSEPEVSKKNG